MKILKYIKRTFLLGCVAFYSLSASAQLFKHERLLSFEEKKVPSFVTTKLSKADVSTLRFKDGKQSLHWTYNPNGVLSIKKDLNFEPKDPSGIDTYLSSFTMWVYNPQASENQLDFVFLKDGKKCSYFSMNLNFKGWRAVYASYERDMSGHPEEGMNEIQIIAPEEDGELFFDLMLTASKIDHRHHTPDLQLPFVNKGISNHWLTLLENSQIKPDPALYTEKMKREELEDIAVMEDRLRSIIFEPVTVNQKKLDKLKEEFDYYQITNTKGVLTGRSMFFVRWGEVFERLMPNWHKNFYTKQGHEYQKYFNLMQKIAINYNSTEDANLKKELGDMFLKMYLHATDQGVAYGSGLGNASHYGYSFRGLFTSYFLMKDLLAQTGHLNEAMKTLQWYAQTNETFIRPIKDGIDMDAFNTLSMGRICSVLIMEDSPEKLQYVRAFSRWIDTGCKPSPGLDGAFKADGGAFHHRNNYPAYAVGGLNGATNMLYILSKTSFAVSEYGHETLKNVLMTMRFYCNTTHFPLSMSGRHPDGKGEIVPMHYARMAVSGTPDGKEAIDKEMAAAYLRLIQADNDSNKPEYMPKSKKTESTQMTLLFTQQGIKAEQDPEGNIALGYGCVSAQRRSNWSAVARGHSRYLWAAEHYLGANLYGRYLAHGSLQIMTAKPGERVTPESSGWLQEGFDWGRIPGATAIHLPVEQLKANVLNVDVFSGFEEMLYSDEAFAGGLSHRNRDGLFAMKLHEHDKYNGSHRARKSYHFFNDRIICLGSDIENTNKDYHTETTIFQLTAAEHDFVNYWNKFKPKNQLYIDHLGTAYFIPKKADNKIVFEKNFPQHSRYQNTGKESQGNWVNLVIDHGKAPKGASYEYVILPQTQYKLNQSKQIAQTYEVIQKDRNAHIVKDNLSNTVSYAFFETPKQINSNIIQQVDTTCLMMVQDLGTSIDLTLSNPDLALYRGESDELLDKDGKRVERSIYSRPWISNESQLIPVTVSLKGHWMLTENNGYILVRINGDHTDLVFQCKDAASINAKLEKVK